MRTILGRNFLPDGHQINTKEFCSNLYRNAIIVRKYDQEIPQSQLQINPWNREGGRATQQMRATGKAN